MIDEGEYFPVKVRDLRRSRTNQNKTLTSLSVSSGYHNSRSTRYESKIWTNIWRYRTRDQCPLRAQHLKQQGRNLIWHVNYVIESKTSLVMEINIPELSVFLTLKQSVVLHDNCSHWPGRRRAIVQPSCGIARPTQVSLHHRLLCQGFGIDVCGVVQTLHFEV